MSPDRIAAASLGELERIYATAPLAPLPGGVWRGRWLHDLRMSAPAKLVAHALFRWPTFGLDLDAYTWWFGRPDRVASRYEPVVGRSRWRDAEVVRLDYRRTMPWPMRAVIYDELKPLSDDCVLGIGGMNGTGSHGAWVYFVLQRI